MRGADITQEELFSYRTLEARIPQKHPLRKLRKVVDLLLATLNDEFDALYARRGRDSIPPERLLRASLLQVLFSIRSERQLVEHIDFNLLYRWFVGLTMDDEVWDHSTFSANRDRLLNERISRLFFERVLALAEWKKLLSDEHFTVDGTLIQAWASPKSFVKKDGSTPPPEDGGRNPTVNFKGEKRSNETHASTTDPDARLARKSNGQAARLCYAGHVVMENRHGLAVAARTTRATGTAERDAGEAMMAGLDRAPRSTLGADKNYDTQGFVAAMRRLGVTPHVAQHTNGRRSAIDRRTTRHSGYAVSQRIRKRIEEVFGWGKEIGGMRRTLLRGLERVGWSFTLRVAAYNLIRLPKLLAAPA